MALVVHGEADPRRLAAERRAGELAIRRQRLRGKRVATLTTAERVDLLEMLALATGLADETGVVV